MILKSHNSYAAEEAADMLIFGTFYENMKNHEETTKEYLQYIQNCNPTITLILALAKVNVLLENKRALV